MKYDDATWRESGMSGPSDLSQSQQAVSGSNNDTPLTVEFNNKSICTITIASLQIITVSVTGDSWRKSSIHFNRIVADRINRRNECYISSVPNKNSFRVATTYGGSPLTTTGFKRSPRFIINHRRANTLFIESVMQGFLKSI